ncbi:SDR family oxidoreductase [Novosphingobium piscinae]|uniref:SDR family oxidoreductase n=1 Tax=Novosphingobium piscinae TaxID=1507448 RepID=A0A7X1FXT8_9SPHN|nr:SDR family oxidoreductase [Novosphingobium piscinae]MBC2668990.1 SDR family oxidoreductase [Novosphingobium piscinae]
MAEVVVTGAGRGIGLELVRQHAAQGDRVHAMARDPGAAGALAELAAQSDGRVSVQAMDVTDEASVRAAAAATGSGPIDLIYNVAGVLGTVPAEFDTVDWAVFDETFAVHVKGPLRVLNAFLPRLGAGARVINFSSQVAASTWPYGGYHAYAASKAALGRLMRSVAADLRERGIIIGIVHPGYVQTDMGGPGAEITPEESARGVLALAAGWPLERSGDFYKWNGEPHPW